MEQHFKPWAGMIGQELALLGHFEDKLSHSDPVGPVDKEDLHFIKISADSLYVWAQELRLPISTGNASGTALVAINNPPVYHMVAKMSELRRTMVHELHMIVFFQSSKGWSAFSVKSLYLARKSKPISKGRPMTSMRLENALPSPAGPHAFFIL